MIGALSRGWRMPETSKRQRDMHLLRWPVASSDGSLVLGSRSGLLAVHSRLLDVGRAPHATETQA